MWAAEVIAKKDIPLIKNDVENWSNYLLKQFIHSKNSGCAEFKKAIEWLGERNYKQAISDCKNKIWLDWLKSNIPQQHNIIIPEGSTITITKGRDFKYALWGPDGIWDLPEEYVGETIKVISKD